jgi:hypothetical protein
MNSTVEQLRYRIEQLEALLGVDRSTGGRMREAFGVEPLHGQILGMLYTRDFVTRDGLYTVLYEGRPESEWPDEKVLDVQICKLRARLEKNGHGFVKIETKWGEGWFIPKAVKVMMRAILDAPPDAVAAVPPPDVPPLAPGAVRPLRTLEERRRAFLDGH